MMMATMTLLNKIRFSNPKLPFKCFKLLSRRHGLLLIIIMLVLMQVTEIYTLNSSNSISMMSTYHHMMIATTSASFSDKKKPLTKKEVFMSSLHNKNEDYLEEDSEEIYDDKIHLNYSANGMIVGSHCESTCDRRLINVFCNPLTRKCECEKNYPVKIGPRNGCAKSTRLGEQCLHDQACLHNDENSVCMQINHNAICECKEGFHSVTHLKPVRKTFCTQDYTTIASDLPTLLGVITGIFTLAGLICMVLHLFSKTKYPRTRTFADAHAGPPIFFASDTGIPLTIQSNRPSSRSSQRSSGSIGSYGGRRSSGILHKGVNVSQSRQGSARSAAILLYSYQLNALKGNPTTTPSPKSRSDEFMAKYIEQQLEDQKRLLYLEVPALRNHLSLMRKLRLNLRSESDLRQLDSYESAQQLIFNSPLRTKLRRKFFKRSTETEMTEFIRTRAAAVDDERSGVNESNMCLNNNDIPKGLITNPMAYSLNDLDDDDEDDDQEEDTYEHEKNRKYIIDNEEIFIGTMPSPACEGGPSIAIDEFTDPVDTNNQFAVKIDVSV